MPRYLLSVRHFDNDYRIDEPEACNCQMTRPRVSSLQGKELEGMDDGGHAGRPPGVAARLRRDAERRLLLLSWEASRARAGARGSAGR